MSKKKKQEEKKQNLLEIEINELKNEVALIQDKYMRSKAELVNYRVRKDTEVANMLKYANLDLVEELIPSIDALESAFKNEDKQSEEIKKFLDGFKLIYDTLLNSLDKFGVKAIDGFNKPFDPVYHQAVLTEEKEGVEEGIVIEVLQKGYLLKDKVIRPAMVKVSK
jgi:molecular chaperone GrpE